MSSQVPSSAATAPGGDTTLVARTRAQPPSTHVRIERLFQMATHEDSRTCAGPAGFVRATSRRASRPRVRTRGARATGAPRHIGNLRVQTRRRRQLTARATWGPSVVAVARRVVPLRPELALLFGHGRPRQITD